MGDEEIDAVEHPERWAEVFDDAVRAALRLADAVSGDGSARLDPDLIGDLRSVFTDDELAEVILVAGQANLNNRVGNAAKQLLTDDRLSRSSSV